MSVVKSNNTLIRHPRIFFNMVTKVAEIVDTVEFVANIDEAKDCLMSQQGALWFNIDVPKGHGIKNGEKVRVIVERLDA